MSAKLIIKIKDRYFKWSTIVDAPVTWGLSLAASSALLRFQKEKIMNDKKCELCNRVEVETEIAEITFDGNTWNACESCREYLKSDYPVWNGDEI